MTHGSKPCVHMHGTWNGYKWDGYQFVEDESNKKERKEKKKRRKKERERGDGGEGYTPKGRNSSYFGLFSNIKVVGCVFALRGCFAEF